MQISKKSYNNDLFSINLSKYINISFILYIFSCTSIPSSNIFSIPVGHVTLLNLIFSFILYISYKRKIRVDTSLIFSLFFFIFLYCYFLKGIITHGDVQLASQELYNFSITFFTIYFYIYFEKEKVIDYKILFYTVLAGTLLYGILKILILKYIFLHGVNGSDFIENIFGFNVLGGTVNKDISAWFSRFQTINDMLVTFMLFFLILTKNTSLCIKKNMYLYTFLYRL